jgi:pimeloyl-ACP methyl ester carboxylesterase
MTIETFDLALPNGITLACRGSGRVGAPLLVFLHGFPEAAFVWDELLLHFAPHWRCIAPNLRGYAGSSAPAEVEAYRARHLVGDIGALVESCGGRAAAVIAHDWGGAPAWNLAAQQPALLERLVIVNSPHPATFLRELRDNPAQQRASDYMNFLRRADAHELLAQNDFARLWPFFGGAAWLDGPTRQRYREVWQQGLSGGCNFYRASPLYPPTKPDDPVNTLQFPAELVTVRVPTRVVWAEDDIALPPVLLDGLEAFVPDMRLTRVPGATHWIVHEHPALVAREIEAELAR